MKIRLSHRIIYNGREHKFHVRVECPFTPQRDFMFVFRSPDESGDDCALIVLDVYGWDATHQELLVRTLEWNVDELAPSNREHAQEIFEDYKTQLLKVVGCEYEPRDDKVKE